MFQNNGLIFLGTGSSSSIPMLHHTLMNVPTSVVTEKVEDQISEEELTDIEDIVNAAVNNKLKIEYLSNSYLKMKYKRLDPQPVCYTCYDALHENSKNRRNNISVLLRSNNSYVIIDVGKTFRDSIIRNKEYIDFTNFHLEKILLTHSHTDAIGGLDDLRDLQVFKKVIEDGVLKYIQPKPIDIYLNQVAFERVEKAFDYLLVKNIDAKKKTKASVLRFHVLKSPLYNRILKNHEHLNGMSNATKDAEEKEKGDIKKNKNKNKYNEQVIEHTTVDEDGYAYTTFDANNNNVKIRFLPVEHGYNYVCVGYIIGNKNKIVYISDASHISDSTLRYIEKHGPIDVLVIDALAYTKKYASHFTLLQSIDYALRIKPKKVYFVGMTCEIEHNITNMYLKKLSEQYGTISFELAYDGLFIPFDF